MSARKGQGSSQEKGDEFSGKSIGYRMVSAIRRNESSDCSDPKKESSYVIHRSLQRIVSMESANKIVPTSKIRIVASDEELLDGIDPIEIKECTKVYDKVKEILKLDPQKIEQGREAAAIMRQERERARKKYELQTKQQGAMPRNNIMKVRMQVILHKNAKKPIDLASMRLLEEVKLRDHDRVILENLNELYSQKAPIIAQNGLTKMEKIKKNLILYQTKKSELISEARIPYKDIVKASNDTVLRTRCKKPDTMTPRSSITSQTSRSRSSSSFENIYQNGSQTTREKHHTFENNSNKENQKSEQGHISKSDQKKRNSTSSDNTNCTLNKCSGNNDTINNQKGDPMTYYNPDQTTCKTNDKGKRRMTLNISIDQSPNKLEDSSQLQRAQTANNKNDFFYVTSIEESRNSDQFPPRTISGKNKNEPNSQSKEREYLEKVLQMPFDEFQRKQNISLKGGKLERRLVELASLENELNLRGGVRQEEYHHRQKVNPLSLKKLKELSGFKIPLSDTAPIVTCTSHNTRITPSSIPITNIANGLNVGTNLLLSDNSNQQMWTRSKSIPMTQSITNQNGKSLISAEGKAAPSIANFQTETENSEQTKSLLHIQSLSNLKVEEKGESSNNQNNNTNMLTSSIEISKRQSKTQQPFWSKFSKKNSSSQAQHYGKPSKKQFSQVEEQTFIPMKEKKTPQTLRTVMMQSRLAKEGAISMQQMRTQFFMEEDRTRKLQSEAIARNKAGQVLEQLKSAKVKELIRDVYSSEDRIIDLCRSFYENKKQKNEEFFNLFQTQHRDRSKTHDIRMKSYEVELTNPKVEQSQRFKVNSSRNQAQAKMVILAKANKKQQVFYRDLITRLVMKSNSGDDMATCIYVMNAFKTVLEDLEFFQVPHFFALLDKIEVTEEFQYNPTTCFLIQAIQQHFSLTFHELLQFKKLNSFYTLSKQKEQREAQHSPTQRPQKSRTVYSSPDES